MFRRGADTFQELLQVTLQDEEPLLHAIMQLGGDVPAHALMRCDQPLSRASQHSRLGESDPLPDQRLGHRLAHDGIAHGARQQLAIHLPLDQIVLRPLLQCLIPQRFILETREHHNGHAGRLRPRQDKGINAVTVRQPQIQQNHVAGLFPEEFQRLAKPPDVGHLELPGQSFLQALVQQAGIAQIVFNQQHSDGFR